MGLGENLGFSKEYLDNLIRMDRSNGMLPESEAEKLPIESACCNCNTFKNPSTGLYDQEYKPEGKHGSNYTISHGICKPCTTSLYGDILKD